MASAGLMILLLVSYSILVPTENTSPPAKHHSPGEASLPAIHNQPREATTEDHNKPEIAIKTVGLVALKSFEKVLRLAAKVTSMVDVTPGKVATNVLSLTHLGVSKLNGQLNDNPTSDIATLKNQIQNLDSTFAKYHAEAKWDRWAAVYGKVEQKINVAWERYLTMMNSLLETKDEGQRKRHVEEFVERYKAEYVHELYYNLKDTGVSFIRKLNDTLAEHVNCHEKDIRSYTDFLSMLMFKGNQMDQLYYVVKGILSEAKLEKQVNLTYEAVSIMNEVHLHCVKHSMVYVKKDVEGAIEAHNADDRQKLADDVWSRLNTVYDRYDWMVVAFKPKMSSHHIFDVLQSHILTKFESVQKDGVIVSIARQVKGPQTKVKLISDTIASCLENSVWCHKVAEKLGKCDKTMDIGGQKIPVVETYTAVHAFMYEKKAHQSHGAMTAPEEGWEEGDDALAANSAQTPYIYTGVCKTGLKKGKFVVMIKSEEEIVTNDPCDKLDCGGAQRGTCVCVPDVFLAMCKCVYPYYGDNCENNVKINQTNQDGAMHMQCSSDLYSFI